MLITDVNELKVWLRLQKVVCIDTETNVTDLDHKRFLVGISFCGEDFLPFYVPVGHTAAIVPVENFKLWDFTHDLRPDVTLVMHNAKFDLKVLKKAGVNLTGCDVADTMLWHHLIDQYRPHSLEALEKKHLDRTLKGELVKQIRELVKTVGMEGIPPIAMAKYAENDVISTLQLYYLFLPQLVERGLLEVWQDDQRFMKLLILIEESGLRLDRQLAQQLVATSTDRILKILGMLPFDPASTNQIAERFYGELPDGLGLKPSKRTPTGKPSTDEATMATIAHPEAGLLVEYRGLQKALSTWFQGLQDKADDQGYVHPSFKQHGTLTHRLSGENPNPQQFPREGHVKKLFLPEEGCDLIEFDYRAIEFRLAAFYAQCKPLIDVFRENGDVHQAVAEALGIGRQSAKNTNFCILYLGGPNRIAETAGIPIGEARGIYKRYHELYPEIFAISDKCESLAKKRGWVKYWTGHKRVFKEDYECRKAFNSIIQGGAFKIIQRSMLGLNSQGVDMRNQVHDSIWINHPKGQSTELIVATMEDWTEEKFGFRFHVESKVLHG
jgi:DNA polymerase-1